MSFIIMISISNLAISNVDSNIEIPKLNWNKAETKLRHFRTFEDIHQNPSISNVGYSKNLSGSGQLTESNFFLLVAKVNEVTQGEFDKIILVDLRLESHGFINGLPVEWKTANKDYNLNKSIDEIKITEENELLKIISNKTLTVMSKIKIDTSTGKAENISNEREIEIFSVATEEEIATFHGLEYIRLPTLDHYRPSDRIVNDFVELIKNNPNSFLHVHCHVGKGRTTTFMAMYDMFYNAKDVEFEEILVRQKAIDGEDLMKHLKKPMDERKRKFAEERLEFLANFYKYCKNSDPFTTSWNVWVKEAK